VAENAGLRAFSRADVPDLVSDCSVVYSLCATPEVLIVRRLPTWRRR